MTTDLWHLVTCHKDLWDLGHLRTLLTAFLDPLQFAYQPHIGVEDAIIFLTQKAISHLEKQGSTVRVMFFKFFSAFNTIQPCLLREKLLAMHLHPDTASWIMDYLTGQPLYVRVDYCASKGCDKQHRRTSRNCTGTIPLHALHLTLLFQLWFLPPPESF